jgi:Glycosyl hydrolase catalytic core
MTSKANQSKAFARHAARAALCVAVLGLMGPEGSAGAAQPGVVLPNPGDQATQAQIAASGAGHVRVFASWRMLEPQRGQFAPYILSGYDALANRLKAAGIPVYLVVTQTPAWASGSHAPNAPPPEGAYADFIRRLAGHFRGRIGAYEIWNEPDETGSWQGEATPGQYAALLKPAYAAAKSADPGARVGVGGLVANDFRFVEGLYAAGAKGQFDFVSLHTDTACNRADPRVAGRDESGRISRWSFTGYREVRASMLDHGDDKPIWMTELGWSVTGAPCPHGGRGAAGVSPARQARFLTRAYACLASDPYVERASWFSLADFGAADQVGYRYGLYDWRGNARPALRAFKNAGRVRPNRSCGKQVDRGGATINIVRPADNKNVSGDLRFKASARDASGLLTLHLLVDGRQIRVTSKHTLKGRWSGWRRLPYGPHKVTFKAVDRAHNVSTRSVTVNHVPYGTGEPIRTRIAGAVYGGGRRRVVAGTLYTKPRAARSSVRGRIQISLERRTGGRWRPFGRAHDVAVPGPVTAARRFKPGRYRAVIRFPGDRSFLPASARRAFTVS